MVERVPLDPQFPLIRFGCGTSGVARKIRRVDESGKKSVIKIVFIPSQSLKTSYNITSEELDKHSGFLIREYEEEMVVPLDPANSTIQVLCGVNGEQTALTKYYDKVLEEIKITKDKNMILKKENERLKFDLKKNVERGIDDKLLEEIRVNVIQGVKEAMYERGGKAEYD